MTGAIEAAGQTDDAYQARACLAYIYSLQSDDAAVLKALPHESTSSTQKSSLPGWNSVCQARGAYIRSSALEVTGQTNEAAASLQAAALHLSGQTASGSSELGLWTERVLSKACLSSIRYIGPPTPEALGPAVRTFGTWGDYWQRIPGRGLQGGTADSRLDVPRREVWRLYHELLSTILKLGLIYTPQNRRDAGMLMSPTEDISDEQLEASRLQQRSQLKRVEATYESLLMQETRFPKASQSNKEVEDYVETVVSNWKTLNGAGWSDESLGHGGKDALGRSVLDTLYRAATKTFHSTAILRQLFTVHAALGEFDLAIHAFESYIEIVGKGKARTEKTGEHEVGLDDDDVALLTAAEAVRLLCRYGDREHFEKAVEIGKSMQSWLFRNRPSSSQGHKHDGNDKLSEPTTESQVSPIALAAAHRAIGTSLANWSRVTYEEDKRSELQAEALTSLRRATSHNPNDLDTAYALALLLADMRDVPAAVQILKRALVSRRQDDDAEDYMHERRKIPLFHLLALCLTARDDFDTATSMCEAALGQFPDPSILYGQESAGSLGARSRSSRGLVDQMEGFEKETVVQLKITQMTFEEMMEGPRAALDQSDELLSLYARLFGSLETATPTIKPPPTAQSVATKQGGTLRSIVGSISGRPGTSRRSLEKDTYQPATAGTKTNTGALQPTGGALSQTSNEAEKTAEKPQHRHHLHPHLPFKIRGHHGDYREAGNLKSESNGVDEKQGVSGGDQAPALPLKDTAVQDHQPSHGSQAVPGAVSSSGVADRTLAPISHNRGQTDVPQPAGHSDQPMQQDTRLPAPHPGSSALPPPRLPTVQNQRQKTSLLVKIWLFVGGLYLRADMFDDAKGAFDEAFKLVEKFELEVAKEDSSARGFFFRGWGGGKGVDELWADVWAEVSEIVMPSQRSILTFRSVATLR